MPTPWPNTAMIEIVTRADCKYCVDAKNWLKSEGISFAEIDATRANISGGVPQLRIDGSKAMEGWNQSMWSEKIEAAQPSRRSPLAVRDSGSALGAVGDFFATSPPPSELHRVAATAAGAGIGYVASPMPIVSVAAGITAVLAGHFLRNQLGSAAWAVKSLGYGAIGVGVAVEAKYRWREMQERKKLPAGAKVMSEADFLAAVTFDFQMMPFLSMVSQADYVVLPTGEIIARDAYRPRFFEKFSAASERGAAARRKALALRPIQEQGFYMGERNTDPATWGLPTQPPTTTAPRKQVATEDAYLAWVRSSAFNNRMAISEAMVPGGMQDTTHIDAGFATLTPIAEYRAQSASKIAAATSQGEGEAQAILSRREADRLAGQVAPPPPPPQPEAQNPIMIALRPKGNPGLIKSTNALYMPKSDALYNFVPGSRGLRPRHSR